MEEGYIEEKEWFKCKIDEITYDCYLEFNYSEYFSKPWVQVTVRKYTQKKWWFFKWREEEFECTGAPDITLSQYRLINDKFYFKSEYVKDWIKGALNRREAKIQKNNSELEEQKNLKVLKEI